VCTGSPGNLAPGERNVRIKIIEIIQEHNKNINLTRNRRGVVLVIAVGRAGSVNRSTNIKP
jgi:hypothetical protein